MILIFKHIFPKRYVGLTFWPLIILKEDKLKDDEVLINHERIHLKQQLELLIIPFYVWYLTEWVVGIFKFRDLNLAYRNISFEKEAYKNENNLNYLSNRNSYAFLKHF
ncbi:hypothetical protein HX109_03085 [Galbibacter sp. BG1]|uniref:hypothetical protein n=1 Tax=Galbibacter sp. BG1 TaxID=1170699 RepID=UPI0015B9131B|nr:hypothetical protein [Galbibacter sp. BG1]QLE00593.1 hypothetical protein HX109_03085 [Galbibacter sp. BG1]